MRKPIQSRPGNAATAGRNDLALVLAAALGATLVAASLLVLVGVRVAQVQTGYRVHDLRGELVRLRQERAALDVEKGALLRPARLAQLARTTLDLVPVDAARALPLSIEGAVNEDVNEDVDEAAGEEAKP